MSPAVLLSFIIGYFLMLIVISYLTSRKSSDNATFFIANRSSKWYLVAFGMIGTALSGVTFISVPGEVGNVAGSQFRYFQFVLGNAVGYFLVAGILLPLYFSDTTEPSRSILACIHVIQFLRIYTTCININSS